MRQPGHEATRKNAGKETAMTMQCQRIDLSERC